eukprot:m.415983 g.415983  ORF g.415983 m.415983 type:complete len:201 (+) comp29775_c0_seq1:299-901(+)
MGCGITKIKREHEEEMTVLKVLHSDNLIQVEENHRKMLSEREEQLKSEKTDSENKWSAKWTATVAEALAAKAAADKADEDARTMRHKAIDRGELAEEVANLTKQKRRLEARVVDLEEAKHLQKLIAEGQKDILKKQQRESEEEAVQDKRRLSATYDEEKEALLEKQAELERNNKRTTVLLRVQTENALALQAGKPNGTSF